MKVGRRGRRGGCRQKKTTQKQVSLLGEREREREMLPAEMKVATFIIGGKS